MSNLFKKTIFLPEIWSKLSIGFERASPTYAHQRSKFRLIQHSIAVPTLFWLPDSMTKTHRNIIIPVTFRLIPREHCVFPDNHTKTHRNNYIPVSLPHSIRHPK